MEDLKKEAPLLEVRHIKKYFPVYGGSLSKLQGYVHADVYKRQGGHDGITFSIKEGCAQLCFQGLDVLAQSWLRDIKALGSLGETALFRDSYNISQGVKIHIIYLI